MNFKKINNIADFLEIWLYNDLLPEEEQKILNHYYRSYKKIFGRYIKNNYCEQTREIIDVLNKIKEAKILEIGSGLGTESLWFAINGASVTGIDISNSFISISNHRKEIIEKNINQKLNCNFLNKSILDLNQNQKYDIIWMEQSFHHLEPREKVLNKIPELLNEGGYIIISETNAWNILNQLILFKHRGFKTIIKNNDHEWGNERITIPKNIIKEFKKRGIKKISNRYFRTMPNYKIANKLYFIDKIMPQLFFPIFTHYNYVGQKIRDRL